ncbi:MAG: RNA-binding protein, partial [bacterium]|nr:RNA-binding protein [bacterium]
MGNLPFDATQSEVEELIVSTGAGAVNRVHLPTGPDGRARGFGFVTMESNEAANAAIVALRDKELKGRRLMVNIAHPRGERPAGGGGDRPPPRRDDSGPPRSFDGGGGG